jgi:hypothetical protein
MRWVERELSLGGGNTLQGFRRMAARNKPAGIRSLVYGVGKGKGRIEGLSVSGAQLSLSELDQAEHECLFGRLFAIADRQCLVDPHCLVPNSGH